MAEIALIVGGCRSGKSDYALTAAETFVGARLFVATAPVTDDDMQHRIEAHRHARRQRDWHTVEEPLDLEAVLRGYEQYGVVLVECLTLWVNNLMYRAEQDGSEVEEAEVETRCRAVMDAAVDRNGTVFFVTNEVGMGVVPENAAARRFRDLAGRANQAVAMRADQVTLVSCGLPVQLKGRTLT